MQCGLFGKLSAKRDFVALSVPRDFLNAWEPWMQSCVSASRDSLGETWLESYLTAPIWRFWLGADICGATVTGALMPSLDGVGRYYPLTLLAQAPEARSIPPPDIDAHDQWFVSAEDFLLSTLDKTASFEALTQALDQLPAPNSSPPDEIPDGLSMLAAGVVAGPSSEFPSLISSSRSVPPITLHCIPPRVFGGRLGGGDCKPFGFCCRLLPDPSVFAKMLTGLTAAE